ncbi:hypothetical protein L873DRAFT_1801676 [Choiromyces venosus 120613-1]|uniref:Uncharacterized protein n=1 Tax=Choiromyces venosus 120613-1 TaxID=1336337 RepID=A0A3N4K0H5_9PEZI|nr:hypothetical protein L873DRAFT_1801676 [Choiromyces venosus 120613-1]
MSSIITPLSSAKCGPSSAKPAQSPDDSQHVPLIVPYPLKTLLDRSNPVNHYSNPLTWSSMMRGLFSPSRCQLTNMSSV